MSARGAARFRRANRLRSPRDFGRVRQAGRSVSVARLALGYARRQPALAAGEAEPPTRIGFSVSKRVGDAVTRNRVKRRLREAARLRLARLAPGWDLTVSARPAAAQADLATLAGELDTLLTRARLWQAAAVGVTASAVARSDAPPGETGETRGKQ